MYMPVYGEREIKIFFIERKLFPKERSALALVLVVAVVMGEERVTFSLKF